jgi:MFS family permease
VLSRSRVVAILLLLDLAYVVNAMDRQVFPVLLKPIVGDLGFNPSEAGLLSTVFTLGMGLAAIPAGYLADRFGRKRMMQLGLIIFSVATLAQVFALGFVDMGLYRILSGVGEGVQNAALYSAVGLYFHRNRGFAVGTLNAAYGVGAFLGPMLGNHFQLVGGWKLPLILFAAFGALVWLLISLGVPKSVTDGRWEHEVAAAVPVQGNGSVGRVLNHNIVLCMICSTTTGLAVFAYIGLYPTYLQNSEGFTSSQASVAAGMSGIGALASVFIGMLGDRWNYRTLTMIGVGGVMVFGAGLFSLNLPIGLHIVGSTVMGLCFTGTFYTTMNTLMQKSVPQDRVGTGVGLFVASYYIPAAVAGLIFALLQVALGWGGAGLIMMAAIPAVGLVAMGMVRQPSTAP